MSERQRAITVSSILAVRLGEFVAGTTRLPTDVAATVTLHIVDTLGCMVAFSGLPWSRAVHDFVADGAGAGPATVARFGTTTTAERAALANGAFAHGFEMDDTEMRTTSHPGAVVVPAALAVAEETHASGAEFLRAVALGYELMIRIGLAAVPMMRRGFHTTSTTGVFGACAAAAALWGLDAATTSHALGIAASRAAGVTEFSTGGGSEKRLHAGFPAQAGVESARLARHGVTAPATALDGPRGFLRAFSDVDDSAPVTRDLGVTWELGRTGFKAYCCCAGQHTVLDAVANLQRAHPALTPDTVAAIRVRQNAREVPIVGVIKEPEDMAGAQFSAAFGAAMRLSGGKNGFTDYMRVDLRDERLLKLARLVDYEQFPESDPLPGDGPARVTITLTDGTSLTETVRSARGSYDNPLSEAEVLAKFHDVADDVLGPRDAARLAERVLGVEQITDVDELTELLVVGESAGTDRTDEGVVGSVKVR